MSSALLTKRAKSVFPFSVIVLLLLLCTVIGCAIVTRLQEESRAVDAGRAKVVDATIRMDAGKLSIEASRERLLEADFRYNVASWRPEISYRTQGIRGDLRVEQPAGAKGIPLGKVRYEWALRLGKDIPMNLRIDLGAGESDLQLGDLLLERLSISTGAGNTKLGLTGRPAPSRLNLDVGAGDIDVDLTGRWRDDLDARIKGGVGNVELQLPRDIGVRVAIQRGVGKIKTTGLSKEGGAFVNEAYGVSKATLDIDIKSGVGQIDLQVER